MKKYAFLVGSLVGLSSSYAHAATIQVGSSCSLANAVASSNARANVGGCTRTGTANPEQINVPQGSYTSNAEFTLTKTVKIVGQGTGAQLDTGGIWGFAARGDGIPTKPTVTIQNMRIRKLSTQALPVRGIWAEDANLILNNVEVSGCNGAVMVDSSDPFGGFRGSLEINDSRIINNPTAGVDIQYVTTTIRRSTISGNLNGGIAYEGDTDSQMLVDSCTISGNSTSNFGGGIYSYGQSRIVNSTIVGNSSGGEGGGIYHSGQELTLWHLTIAGNSATGVGGGLRWTGSQGWFLYSIIAKNTGAGSSPDLNMGVSSAAKLYNLIGVINGYESVFDSTNRVGTAAAPLDPKLAALASNGGPTQTRALNTGSKAIDAIPVANYINLGFGAVDQRGVTRPRDGNANGTSLYDIGAYER